MELLLYGFMLGVITVFMGGIGYSLFLDFKVYREHRKAVNKKMQRRALYEGFRIVNGGGR